MWPVTAIVLSYLMGSAAFTQNETTVDTAPLTTPSVGGAPAPAIVPNGTPIVVMVTDRLSSETAGRDDMFNLSLAEPVMLNGLTVIPAGTPGKGQVVDAAKAGAGGKPGKLVLAARYLEFEGRQIPIKGLTLDLVAKDESLTAAIVAAIKYSGSSDSILGGPMVVPAGMRGSAKLAVNFVPNETDNPTPTAQEGAAPPSAITPTNSGTAPPAQPQSNAATSLQSVPQNSQ